MEIILNEHNKVEYPPMHTVEHILNQTMVRMFGCERSKNSHIEKRKSKCDYKISIAPTSEQIEAIEAKKREEAAKLAAQQAAAQAEANKQQALQNQVTQGTVTRAPYAASPEDIHLLAAIIYWESGWEPAHGQLAVANVVLNRVYSPRFKQNNIPDVIYAPGQFTGVLENGKISASGNHKELMASCDIYQEIYEQQTSGKAGEENE